MTEKQNKVSVECYKGVRDFYPEDMAIQNYIFDTWRKVAKEFGYVEYGASILEYADLYKAKGERNEEIVNEQMYTFTDKGDREVALRPEMTPTLARMIAARRKGLKLPLRWFSIPNCFRYERTQRGRRREHWQLNCDLMGVTKDFSSVDADVEIISLAHKIITEFGAENSDFIIRINYAGFFAKVLEKELGFDTSVAISIVKAEDRYSGKISPSEFTKKLIELIGETNTNTYQRFFENLNQTDVHKKYDEYKHCLNLTKILRDKDIEVIHSLFLTRGFDYYTGIIFEVYDSNSENNRALFGGGRYDNLLEMFGVEPLPTVGFGMGDVTIRDFLETHKLPPFDSK